MFLQDHDKGIRTTARQQETICPWAMFLTRWHNLVNRGQWGAHGWTDLRTKHAVAGG